MKDSNPLTIIAKVLSIPSALVVTFVLSPDLFHPPIIWKGTVTGKFIARRAIPNYELIVSDNHRKDYVTVSNNLFKNSNIGDTALVEYTPEFQFVKRVTVFEIDRIKQSQCWIQLIHLIGGLLFGLIPLLSFKDSKYLRTITFNLCTILLSSGFMFFGLVFLKRHLI